MVRPFFEMKIFIVIGAEMLRYQIIKGRVQAEEIKSKYQEVNKLLYVAFGALGDKMRRTVMSYNISYQNENWILKVNEVMRREMYMRENQITSKLILKHSSKLISLSPYKEEGRNVALITYSGHLAILWHLAAARYIYGIYK